MTRATKSVRAVRFAVAAMLTTAAVAFAAGTGERGSFDVEPVAARAADRDAVVAGNTAFALDVYGSLRNEPGNLVFSPLSLSTALAMAADGSAGKTRREFASVLHIGLRPARMGRAFQSVLSQLEPVSGDVQIEVANAVWTAGDVPFRPGFVRTLAKRYGARAAELVPASARDDVNRWGAEETHGLVPEVLDRDVSPDAALLLTNAIWFRGKWKQPFDERTPATFKLADGTLVESPLMRRTGTFGRADGPGFRAVELPYRGEDLAMLVLVPDRADGLPAVEAALTPASLAALARKLEPDYVDLWFPPFSLERRTDFAGTLRSLGLDRALDPRRADFSRAIARGWMWIEDVRQGASIRVDEEGTVAAAVTVVALSYGQAVASEPTVVRVDRPFLFLIRHRPTGTILFLGRVADPTK